MAENFIVSARKYRPDNWDSVVGQKAITTTLRNAIETNQIAQAYLFTGSRGVGKTSCARIFAKAINNMLDATPEELAFTIFELDAASNNGVDDIRAIVDTVRIPPQVGKYKVYVIDEVHMLSASAFNAFLKTLEEPPAHAIFILATTEKHKIIPTILSRCQIFDFNRIKVKDMTEHLQHICKQEGIEADEDALHVIASKADGAMRDALSIFDQVVAFCGRKLSYDLVIQNLNVLDYEYYFKLTDLFFKEDIPNALLVLNEVVEKGFDVHHFVTGLGAHFRNLLVCRDAQTLSLMEVTEGVASKYKDQAAASDLRFLIQGIDLVNDADYHYKSSRHPRLLVELLLMKLCSVPQNLREGEKKKVKILAFRGAEKFIGAPQARSSNPTPVKESKPDNEIVIEKEESNDIGFNNEKQLPNKTTLDPEKRKLVGLSPDNISIRYNPQIQIETAADEPVEEEKAERIYTEEEIQQAWNGYVEELMDFNSQSASALKVTKLIVQPENEVQLIFPGTTQMEYFNEERAPLMSFMRKRGVVGLKLKLEVAQSNSVAREIVTDRARFEKMMEKNPAVKTLWERFKLVID